MLAHSIVRFLVSSAFIHRCLLWKLTIFGVMFEPSQQLHSPSHFPDELVVVTQRFMNTMCCCCSWSASRLCRSQVEGCSRTGALIRGRFLPHFWGSLCAGCDQATNIPILTAHFTSVSMLSCCLNLVLAYYCIWSKFAEHRSTSSWPKPA